MTKNAICFGEVLWDLLPGGAVPGGAPMNVAIRLQSLGIQTKIISRTGDDGPGKEIRSYLENKGVDTSLVQSDPELETGKVVVSLDKKGIASYDIVAPSAWDNIEPDPKGTGLVEQADAFVFGSLACRSEVSRNTLFQLLDHARFRVFDVNLRPPFYGIPLIRELIGRSDLVKLNDDELMILANEWGSKPDTLKDTILFLSDALNIGKLCVTRGEQGAILFMDGQFYNHGGLKVRVMDTVGAGDGFLAALVSKLLSGTDPEKTLAFACAVGALVASRTGANPEIKDQDIQKLIRRG